MEARTGAVQRHEEQEQLFAITSSKTVQTHLRNRELDGWQAHLRMLNDLHYLLRVQAAPVSPGAA